MMRLKIVFFVMSIAICESMLGMKGFKVTAGHVSPQAKEASVPASKPAAANPCTGQKTVTTELQKQCNISTPVGALHIFKSEAKPQVTPATSSYQGAISLDSVKEKTKSIMTSNLKPKKLGVIKQVAKGFFDFPKSGQMLLYSFTPTEGSYKNQEMKILLENTGSVADRLKSWLTIYVQTPASSTWRLIGAVGSELNDIGTSYSASISYVITVSGQLSGEIRYDEKPIPGKKFGESKIGRFSYLP